MEWHKKYSRGVVAHLALACPRRYSPCIGFALTLSVSFSAWAAQSGVADGSVPVRFNTAFIQGSDQPPDLQEFLRSNSVLPGTYRVDIYVNRTLSGRRDVTFSKNPLSGLIEPCLSLDMLKGFGLDLNRLPADTEPGEACFDLPARVEFARVDYQPAALRLSISIPQAVMVRGNRGYVAPELWDQGETAGFINYTFNGSRRRNNGVETDQYYVGLRNGLNIGAWRLRNESSLVQGNDQPWRYRSNRTFAQRDITLLKSQLTVGETFTDAQVFDSVRFQGAALVSDEGMLSDSERTYAPVIRGIAETNATVEVRQNGFLLYSGSVSPGPFEITDIYPSGSNGDLSVTVIEADGRVRSFTQAYASLPIMVPAGSLRYSLAAGQVDTNDGPQASPGFGSVALIYGLSERLTGFGGLQLAEGYQAANAGAGLNTGVGAVSLDITRSVSRADNQSSRGGQSLRLRYANTLDVTNTTLAVAGYRYSTEDYRTLDQHVSETHPQSGMRSIGRARDRLELSVTQTVPVYAASLSLTTSEQRYWNLPGKTRQLYLSWNAAWRTLNYSLSIERNEDFGRSGEASTDNRIALSVTVPLGASSASSRLSFNAVRDSSGQYNAQAGLNGQVLGERNTFYSLQAGHDSSSGSFGAGKINTTTGFGRFEAGFSQGQDYDAFTLAASGSLVAHAGGVNFGQTLGETFALVQVPEVSGARLRSFSNVETANNGYAVLPYVQAYRTNWVSLDTRQLGADVDLGNAITQVVPRRGAVPVVRFKASVGRRVQFELVRGDGSRVPLGASVEDEQGRALAVVDPTSQALVLSERDTGHLHVRWADQHCQAAYSLPPRDPARAYERMRVVCQ
ncbi:fimbria/pilus outer membrane usher protein [Pseudomonas syringae]|uniref:Fimbria/pilus outer membrane usher protein n=1 Tax=Pseudomonas syringae TaxID=317 RepID=A0A9Q4A4H4_PSESX|nr:fimbria/pilus outer membrane usher protein [Pseudomonas syringae]MCF5467732.1 fimbria/pilus outer membrane usher protein [Pseudomonas syringae]MCF5474538.1 fimbria/pilus outer membrane usher protein [Pseudomonas syringae]MCF5484056.1 fimbria/pilus outer membrane usher protein [Pseudomonas syringae]MCF5487831.1 fimbria/pilus outer membrane usher protein [Pseudomonas syringae]MCF5493137.1 fimbria/pilus outer membrane usher protein [Pseudomonas syringae]